ncbi:Translocase of chloroplast 120 [Picochlorum sp. SENEW3]|nr:Translocase of chloroplast 120 [Picochlorum sp. SENEW3]
MSDSLSNSSSEVYLSDPMSGDEEGVRTEDDYEYGDAPEGNVNDAPEDARNTTGSGLPKLPPRPRPASQTRNAAVTAAVPQNTQQQQEGAVEESPKVAKIRKQVQGFRTDIYRAALRLRYPTRSTMIQQVMFRLGMAEKIHLESQQQQGDVEGRAQAEAERLEVLGEPLDFSCKVLVLGMAGVGKTATLHNLLGIEPLSGYHPTDSVQILRGEVNGIGVTFIDTPGLNPGPSCQADNLKILHAAKRAFQKHKPHAVLYMDRMDVTRRDQADVAVMRSISDVFGPDIWFSTMLTLTHGGSPPPDGANGQPIPQESYETQRSNQVQQVIRLVTGDQRLINPSCPVENSPNCPKTEDGEPVLPNGTPWRRQLLMLCLTTMVLNEANTALKPGDVGKKKKKAMMNPYAGMKMPPIGWLLSRLVDFRGPRKAPEDEREIPMQDEINRMSGDEKAAALRKKRIFLKQKAEEARSGEAAVPILAPPPQLGPTFDSDVSSHHFNVLEDPTSVLVRPIVGEGGIDHQDGVDTIHIEKQGVLRPRGQYLGGVPCLAYCQLTKDKDQFACQSQVEGSYFHTSGWASTMEVNGQTIGRDVLYTSRAETRLKTGKRNKLTAGMIVSKLGEDYSHPFKNSTIAYGMKIDDRIKITPNAKLRTSIGRVYCKAAGMMDHGTAAAADLRLRPDGDPSTRLLIGGSAVFQKRDTTIGGNIATEFRLPKLSGRGGKSDTIVSANSSYNNKGNGTIATRINSHDYPQLALAMIIPVVKALWDGIMSGENDF